MSRRQESDNLLEVSALMSVRERALRAVTRGRGVGRVVNGIPLRVASPVRALFTGDYDRPLADFLKSRIEPGDEVWNVGANVGIWALQIATWVGPSGRVVAHGRLDELDA
jgi:hypothetical protein